MRPPHPYAPALDLHIFPRLAKNSSSSSQIPQESSTLSIDLPPPHEAFSRDALKKPLLDSTVPTGIASSVKGAKRSNSANLKQLTRRTKTRLALNKEKCRCAKLEEANQELSQQMTAITATLDYGYDHVFVDKGSPKNAEERRRLRRALRANLSFEEADEWFTYECPTCRRDVTKTPCEVHTMKDIMESFAANIHPHLEDSVLARATNADEFAGLFIDGDSS
ncbi:hypothetical protein BDN71DRAFT_1434829 [Pleurotus eryngii]|uniref:Uncharacterized protein n=1 Tax=Pleurotus eryngii TaxID=5323 RepID=A0A9P5ZQ00_PLEER|nr:hypothetical protein BDN71DRAFT_1434829 [Pleurotus eryngii]